LIFAAGQADNEEEIDYSEQVKEATSQGAVMSTTRRGLGLCSAGLALVLSFVSGCQTWVPEAGLTLPTGDYLRHPPQYIPPSPPFPLSRELATLERAAQQQQDERIAPFAPFAP